MENKKKTTEKKYSRAQLLKSKRLTVSDKYLLFAILEDKEYTLDQVESLLKKEKRRRVN